MAEHAPLPLAGVSGPRGVTRSRLAQIGEGMVARFQVLGQGVIMGSMPSFVRRFGIQNARYVHTHYMPCDPAGGAVSALGPMNFVSKATGTAYELPIAGADRAVKRLKACEFQAAFADKSDFAKAMICRLHEAVYEGSVNGLVEDPPRDGYRVALRSRILFGSPHCEFQVDSVKDRQGEDPGLPLADVPSGDGLAEEQHHFYAAILVAFIEYLCQVLPEEDVQVLVADCADRVGADLARVLDGSTPSALVRDLLTKSDRAVQSPQDAPDTPATQGSPGNPVTVTACPFVRPIKGATRHLPRNLREAVRRSACGTCLSVLQGAVEQAAPGTTVRRTACIVNGDPGCTFDTEAPT